MLFQANRSSVGSTQRQLRSPRTATPPEVETTFAPQLVRTLCSSRKIVNQNRAPSGNLLPKLHAANRATGASFVKLHLSRQYGTDALCTDGKSSGWTV